MNGKTAVIILTIGLIGLLVMLSSFTYRLTGQMVDLIAGAVGAAVIAGLIVSTLRRLW